MTASHHRTSNRWTILLVSLLLVCGLTFSASPVLAETTRTVCPAGCDYTTIQAAIAAADPGDTILVGEGTYTGSLTIAKDGLTITGAGPDVTILQAGSGYAVDLTGDSVTLTGMRITGQPGTTYGVKASGCADLTLTGLLVENTLRTAFDLNGVNGAVLTSLEARGVTAGNGLSVTDSHDVLLDSITTSTTAWGGIALYTRGEYYPGGSSNITLQGANSLGGPNPLFVQLGFVAPATQPWPLTGFTQAGFGYTVTNPVYAPNTTYYQPDLAGAAALLAFSEGMAPGSSRAARVESLLSGDWVVLPGMSIQTAINAASAGDTVLVYPGTYLESAPGSTLFNGGTYQFGLFFAAEKDGLTLQGVDAAGNPISDASQVLARVNTDATNNFGPSGFFVEADNISILGIEVGTNLTTQNKTIEVIGDNFTFKNSKLNDPEGSLYFNDWRFDSGADESHLKSYTIEGNIFAAGVSLDLANGAGYSGPASGRVIRANAFDLGGASWPAISFSGSGTGVPWFVYSVGGAVIEGNTFVNGQQYIRARGDYDNSQFDWAAYFTANTFDRAVVAGPNPPADLRAYQYTSGSYVFNNVRRIGALIQPQVDIAQPGDTILIAEGTYVEQVVLTRPVSLVGSGPGTVIQAPASLPAYFISSGTTRNYPVVFANGAGQVHLKDLVVDGNRRGSTHYRFNGVGYYNTGGSIEGVEITRITDTAFSGSQHGVALYVFNGDGALRNLEVSGSTIHDFQKNATVFYGSGLVVEFHHNVITGAGPTGVTAQNGIQFSTGSSGRVYGNTISGISYTGANWTASAVLVYDVYVVNVNHNTITGSQTSIYHYGGNATITGNTITTSAAEAGTDSLYGIVVVDPPTHLPDPFDADLPALPRSGSQVMATDTVRVTYNTVTGGGDAPGSVGIASYSGYTAHDVDLTVSGNDVSGWDYGLEIYDCESGCQTGVFTSLVIRDNRVFNNRMGMYANIPVDASLNWWGTLSWAGYGPVTGIPALLDGPITWQPWRDQTLTETLTIPDVTYADDDNAGLSEGQPGVSGGVFGYNAFATIGDALRHVADGGQVRVGPGVYAEEIVLPQTMSGLSLIGAGADQTFIEGLPGGLPYTLTLLTPNAVVDGFTIRQGGGDNSIAVSWSYLASGSVLRNSAVEGHLTGIYLASGLEDSTIERSHIHGNANGILIEGVLSNVLVANNFIVDNDLSDDYWVGKENAAIRTLNTYAGTLVQVIANAIGGSAVGIDNNSGSAIDAARNWWGSPSGPTTGSNPGGSGALLSGPAAYIPWLCDGTDSDPAIGFQPAAGADTCTTTATRLVFVTQPAMAYVNIPFADQPVVRAEDDHGNLAVNFNNYVFLQLGHNPAGGALLPTLYTQAVNGVAAFSGLYIDQVGQDYRLAATSGSLDPAIGQLFDVLPHLADLSVGLTAAPNPVTAGEALTYTVQVANLGPMTAQSVTLTLTLPAGVTYTSASGSGWTCGQAAGLVTCTRPSLASGSAPDVTVQAAAPETAGLITATAVVSHNQVDPVAANNSASADTLVVILPPTGGSTLFLPIVTTAD